MAKEVKKETKEGNGLTILFICGIIAVALIVACVFFPEEFFGLFKN